MSFGSTASNNTFTGNAFRANIPTTTVPPFSVSSTLVAETNAGARLTAVIFTVVASGSFSSRFVDVHKRATPDATFWK